MIEAYFTVSGGTVIPALLPNEEILELAQIAGMSLDDLFSISIPGGASRNTSIKVCIAQDRIATLYANNGPYGVASCTFSWRESSGGTLHSINVSLLPPRPLYMIPGHAGVSVVEAVDVRYWWRQTFTADAVLDVITGPMFSSDGRWMTSASNPTLLGLLQSLRDYLTAGTFSTAGYLPNAALINRLADYKFTPDMSIGVAIDLVLSQSGYVLLWMPSLAQKYGVQQIQNNTALLNSWMNETKRAYDAGMEPTSASASGITDPLLGAWLNSASSNVQINRMPSQALTSFPYRTVEGKTVYCNADQTFITSELKFAERNEFGVQIDIPTFRSRATNPASVALLREPRPLHAPESIPWDPSLVTPNTQNFPTPPAWDWSSYRTQVATLLARRCEMPVGRTVWMGWPLTPDGVFRGTMLRYHLGQRSRKTDDALREDGDGVSLVELLPITTTICDDDDWIFGPSGRAAERPEEIVMGKGLAQVRRLGSGVTTVDVAPPNCRVFPARITSASAIGESGDDKWKWVYTFTEIEPNPLLTSPLTVPVPKPRMNSSRNLMENANRYFGVRNPANFIAPGHLQADYLPEAEIVALPICVGAVVMMCEHFLTLYEETGSPPFGAYYWFSCPNAVKVTCIEEQLVPEGE